MIPASKGGQREEKEMNRLEIELTYESLIALLQGKEFHLQTPEIHVIFHPPFDGVFMSHDQLRALQYNAQADVFKMIEQISKYKEERESNNKTRGYQRSVLLNKQQ